MAVDEFRVLPLDVGVGYRFRVSGSVTPFVGAGVSVLFLDAEPARMNNQVGWYARAGVDIHLMSNLFLFGEAFWREADADYKYDEGGVEKRTDITVGGFGANLGVVWRF